MTADLYIIVWIPCNKNMHNKINQGFSLLGSTPIMFPFQDNYSNKEKKMIEFP